MKLFHTSPVEIKKITKTGMFGDCLFFALSPYGLGNIVNVYSVDASEMSFTKKNIKIQISKNEYTSKCTAACKSVSSLGTRSLDGSFSSQIKTYTADNQLVELRGTTSTGLYIYSDLKSVSALTIQDNAEITLILNNLKPL